MVLKTRKTGSTNQLHVEFTLRKPSFPCNVPPFYPKICPLTSKIQVKWGSLWPYSYIFVFVGGRTFHILCGVLNQGISFLIKYLLARSSTRTKKFSFRHFSFANSNFCFNSFSSLNVQFQLFFSCISQSRTLKK